MHHHGDPAAPREAAARRLAVALLDGRRPHAMLVELFTATGAGTLITP